MDKQYSNAKVDDHEVGITTGMLLGRKTVMQWEEGGSLWRVDEIEPRMVGASLREYELFENDEPARGGRYHSTIEGAVERAEFCSRGSMANQIDYLWQLVRTYRQRIADLEGGIK